MKVAAIDIGTNSIHMIIAADAGDGTFETLDREKDVVRLGAGAFKLGRISDTAFAAGLDALSKFKQLIDRHGVDDIVAVATSAVREAENGAQFLDAVKRTTGIQPRMISGKEEARLIHYAVRAALDLRHRKALMIDIGGGSVEVAVAGFARLRMAQSLKLGVLRLRDEINREDPLSDDGREKLAALIRERAAEAMQEVRDTGFDLAVATSGTALNLGIAIHLKKGTANWISPHGRVITLDEVRELTKELLALDADKRAKVPGIDPDRGDTIHLGALLLTQLLEMAGASSLMLCEAAIREGIVYERLSRAGEVGRSGHEFPNLRRNSVLRLARKCGQENPHPRQIVKLALQIFDQTATVHGMNNAAREMLEYAAWLHDAGRAIGFERHEQLSYYIIRY
ncbi:MAG: Ppx/GppA family phosphatase, partial [Deltaproteobacteria bacterium]|nr:Ppx/GppA family phosphatase [Deltaproteobacteria bacterium]